jgi:hypothetical protein
VGGAEGTFGGGKTRGTRPPRKGGAAGRNEAAIVFFFADKTGPEIGWAWARLG